MSQVMIQSATHSTTSSAAAAAVVGNATMVVSPPKGALHRKENPSPAGSSSGMALSSHSSLASKAIGEGNYKQALEHYQLALESYLTGSPTVVELVNAAATCFNLGALSKKLHNYTQAADYFCQAEELYKSCSKKVRRAPAKDANAKESDASCEVCLFQLIVETLQARAHLRYKYQNWLDEAIECHEEVVEVLEQQIEEDRDVVYFKIHFKCLSREDRSQLIITSLQSLGKFYVEKGEFEDGLVAYQEALSVMKDLNTRDKSTKQRQDEITQIIKVLSDIYMKSNTASIRVPQLQRVAQLQEDLENWDKALSCWERVLYLESQEHGEESVQVADTLCQIGRVMVAQGNQEGALDLYHAAAAKYRQSNAPLSREVVGNTTNIFCQLQMHDDALDWLDGLMVDVQDTEEESWILCQRGRVFLEQGRLKDASTTLCRSVELCESDDDYAFKLLQKLEFLQQRTEGVSPSNLTSISLDMSLECILEDDETSTVAQDAKDEPFRAQTTAKSTLDGTSQQVQALVHTIAIQDEQRVDVSVDGDLNAWESPRREQFAATESAHSKASNDAAHSRFHSPMDDLVLSDDEESGEQECPTPAGLLKIRPRLPAAPTTEESKVVHLVTPTESSRLDRKILEGSRSSRREDGSKSTEETEQSVESGADQSPHTKKHPLGLTPTTSSPSSVHELRDPTISCDGSESESGFYFLRVSAEEAEEESASLESSTHISDVKRFIENESQNSETQQSISEPKAVQKDSMGELSVNTGAPPTESAQSKKFVQRESDSPESSTSQSRAGLLQNEDKDVSRHKSLRVPPLSSPRSQKAKDRRDYIDISQPGKPASRNRIVKALASPFRRSRIKKTLSANGLDALDEDKEIKGALPSFPKENEADDETSQSAADAPISYIAMRGNGDDDDQSQVSQITFKIEEQVPQKSNNDSQWWWGVTAEGFEGWFPTTYVSQAVEAAEGFLSAKSIHERVKSRPLDFDSDEESEEGQEEELSIGKNKEHSMSSHKGTITNSDRTGRKASTVSSAKPSSVSVGTSVAGPSRSVSSKKTTIESQIEEKRALLEESKATDGPEQTSVAAVLFDLAVLHGKNGEAAAALNSAQQALKIQKATLSMSEACKTLHFMADVHSRSKHYKAALACYKEAQQLQEAVVGYFHEDTANTLNRIGNVLARQGEFDMAMANHREALRILKECCGEEIKNPLVSQTLIQIGAVYYKERNSLATIQAKKDGYTTFIEGGMLEVIGRAHEERGSYRMAIAFFEEKLQFLDDSEGSKDMEQVAETLNSLGMLSCRAGLYLEAIDYYDRALEIQIKLGCDDVQLAMARVLAGSVQYSLGHFSKALQLFEDAIRTLRDNIGEEQETVAATLFHMGIVRVARCEFDKAMGSLQEALKIQTKLLGNGHPASLRTRREIGNLFALYEADLDTAFSEYNDILATQKRIHGERHPNVAETLHCIGCAQARKGDLPVALKTLEGCYNMRLEFLGTDHPLQATTLHEIAKIQLKKGRFKHALRICDSVLHIRKESLSENHADVADALATKASCFVAKGSFNDANKLFLEAHSIAEESVGPSHPLVADILVQMGVMHLRTCDFDKASESINQALKIYRMSKLDEDYPGIKEALTELERVERAEMLCV